MAEEPKLAQAPGAAEGAGPGTEPALDAAGQSLADALRLSFRILTFVILFLLVLFVCRGFFTVQSDQKALILRFGHAEANRVRDQGLHYAFPYPIDEVVRVGVSSKDLEVNTYWPRATEQAKEEVAQKGKELPKEVLGAEDAYMLTGDLNVLEARWNVTYSVRRDSDAAIVNYYSRIGSQQNEEALVRVALQSAIVREIGRLGVFEVYPQGKTQLLERVKASLDRLLEDLECGIQVSKVSLSDIRPPLAVKPAFDAVLVAQQRAPQNKENAERDRRRMLIEAAGDVGIDLGDTIANWWAARRENRAEDVKAAEAKVSELFQRAGGKVKAAIAEANTYKTTIQEQAKGDAAQLASLLERSERDRKIYLEHARVDALQGVLEASYEKYIFRPKQDGTRGQLELWLNRRPELLREMRKVEETQK